MIIILEHSDSLNLDGSRRGKGQGVGIDAAAGAPIPSKPFGL